MTKKLTMMEKQKICAHPAQSLGLSHRFPNVVTCLECFKCISVADMLAKYGNIQIKIQV
jgi:hypothetical protein